MGWARRLRSRRTELPTTAMAAGRALAALAPSTAGRVPSGDGMAIPRARGSVPRSAAAGPGGPAAAAGRAARPGARGDHRPAPAGGVASHQLAGLDGASQPRRHLGCDRPALGRRRGPDPRRGGERMNSTILAAAQDPTLQTFENDVWWITLIKLFG